MQVSIIIPTYNRPKDLAECLDSISNQAYLPFEVLIIDNGNVAETKKFVKKNLSKFGKRNISLSYIKNDKENSLTLARNIGARNARGDIVLFLDDDVILDKDYLKEILKVYEEQPDALGVQGFIEQEKVSKIRNIIYKIFFLYHLERNCCRALPSGSVTYPYELGRTVSCQWLSGASSYRKQILKEFKFDEKLKKYSDGEDLEFSYRVFRKYQNSLYITPYAKMIHKTAFSGRALGKELINMREVYGLYIFYKFFNHTIRDRFIYIWSRIGRFLITLVRVAIRRPTGGLLELIYLVGAYYLCLRHLGDIKQGKLEFFNQTLV